MKNRKTVLTMFALLFIVSTIIISSCDTAAKTTEYIFPEIILNSTGQTQDSAIEELKPHDRKDDLVENIRKGSNGSIIIELTDSQLKIWLDDIEQKMQQAKKDVKSIGCEITINADCTEFIYKVSRAADSKQVSMNAAVVMSRCMQYQIFHGTSPDEMKLQSTIINIENGKVMASVSLDEQVTINPEDWDE